MDRLRHCNALRRFLGVALLSLMLGQWTVLVHAIEHARASASASVAVDGDQAWGHQAGSSACHLVDHLLTGQAPGGESTTALHLPPAASHLTAPESSIARGPVSRAYQARGPPPA